MARPLPGARRGPLISAMIPLVFLGPRRPNGLKSGVAGRGSPSASCLLAASVARWRPHRLFHADGRRTLLEVTACGKTQQQPHRSCFDSLKTTWKESEPKTAGKACRVSARRDPENNIVLHRPIQATDGECSAAQLLHITYPARRLFISFNARLHHTPTRDVHIIISVTSRR